MSIYTKKEKELILKTRKEAILFVANEIEKMAGEGKQQLEVPDVELTLRLSLLEEKELNKLSVSDLTTRQGRKVLLESLRKNKIK